MSSILYHCTCTSDSTASNVPPEPTLPSSAFAFHALHTLYFCEECDLVRCNRCVSVEVSGYYCPNCLFEVPSASVRAEKNRCARNCFQCPHCRNTLSVVPSDPPEEILAQPRPPTANESIGEPPFFLYCNFCRWDSQEVGIVFEKPTGLALQLQKLEDNLPDSLEFERLKDHFEPILRASSSSHHNNSQPSHHRNPITAAASSALARDVPGLHQPVRGMSGRTYSNPKAPSRINANKSWDDWDSIIYKSRLEVAGSGVGIRIESELDWIKALDEGTGTERVADLERRWLNSWTQSLKSSELQPLRIPLHSKKTKRCPDCRHILIKPEQKAQSVRYKIKLMAANYLPSIEVVVPSLIPPPSGGSQLPKSKIKDADDSGALMMQPGKSYPFQMIFTNPLYEPIQVRVSVHRAPPRITSGDAVPQRPPFGITLPSNTFPISAFAEAWEYEDDEDMFDEDDLEQMLSGNSSGGGLGLSGDSRSGRGPKGNVGVLERKANVTKVGGEVLIGRDASGEVKFNMQVSYTYRADDSAADASPKKTGKDDPAAAGEMKTFTFFTLVSLGSIAPKVEAGSSSASKRDSASTARSVAS